MKTEGIRRERCWIPINQPICRPLSNPMHQYIQMTRLKKDLAERRIKKPNRPAREKMKRKNKGKRAVFAAAAIRREGF